MKRDGGGGVGIIRLRKLVCLWPNHILGIFRTNMILCISKRAVDGNGCH